MVRGPYAAILVWPQPMLRGGGLSSSSLFVFGVEAAPLPKPLPLQLFLASFACLFSNLLFPSLSQLLWRWPRMPTWIAFLFLQCGGQQAKMEFLLSQNLVLPLQFLCQEIGSFDGMAKLHCRKVLWRC